MLENSLVMIFISLIILTLIIYVNYKKPKVTVKILWIANKREFSKGPTGEKAAW